MQHVGGAKNGFALMIVYHCYRIEKTRFLKDMVWQTKALSA
jgi:hypothetical protein